MRRNDSVASVITFQGAFTPEECATIRERSRPLPLAEVDVYPLREVPVRRAATRIIDDPRLDWVRERLLEYAHAANDRLGVVLHDEVHPMMAVTYPTGGFFDWHIDLGHGNEATRKISISVQLTDPADYEGGELHIVSHEKPLPRGAAGTLVAFPAHLAHRVLAIQRGEREALVAWVHGPSFR